VGFVGELGSKPLTMLKASISQVAIPRPASPSSRRAEG
jgi:hypothetical protein